MARFLLSPNVVSMFRVFSSPILAWFFLQDGIFLIPAFVVFTFAVLSDAYDGHLARRYDQVTKAGALLDPLADKILVLSMLATFWYKGLVDGWVVVLVLLRDVFVTTLKVYADQQGFCLPTLMLAKYKTFMQFMAIYLVFSSAMCAWLWPDLVDHARMMFITNVAMYGVAFLTAYTATSYWMVYQKNRKQFYGKQSSAEHDQIVTE
ncbi:MAG: CDP-alcohol phosphatidyltransferase family protein [Epsilonproteobacteria bacterium]|nr:CDP-alcohol phosphatidyltransferase family protein [Campylobacterota bacterium]